MEQSILKSTKKILGLPSDHAAFDLDVITHINSTFSVLTQLGVGPSIGFMIEDDQASWEDFIAGDVPMNMVRTYVHLKVRVLFDPPPTSFHLDALNKQIQEYEWRLNLYKDVEPV